MNDKLNGVPADNAEENSGGVEFSFDAPTPESETSLEFEFVTENEGLVFNSEADISPDTAPAVAEVVEDKPEDTAAGEFTVPESFEVNPKYNTQSFIEDPIRVRTTYVPRFTEVSENYRMADDPRPREVTDAVRTASPVREKPSPRPTSEKRVDPTAEIDEERVVEKVIVTPTAMGSTEPTDESIKVFKFVPEAAAEAETEAAEELDAAVSEALELADGEEETPTEEPVAEEPVTASAAEPASIDEPTEISYEDSGVFELPPEEAPPESLPTDKKRGFSAEFSSPIQRDSIKDRFLDTVMSVKVRLAVSLVLLLGMLTFDFLAHFAGFKITDYIIADVGGAMAFVDFQLALCLVLLAIPELVRAVKYLCRGSVLPEVGIIPAIAILGGYTAVIFALGESEYPLFGVLVGCSTVSAIVSAYFRSQSDFSAFKLISKNGVKRVLDQRLTRSLPRENMALDGVIDEYNSTCARSFRTAFVTDFYERCSRVRVHNFTVILMLVLSFGIALVSGTVNYFVSGNDLSVAVRTFTMVFLVSYPAFSILTHAIPFSHAEREAGTEEGCFIGEDSVYSCAEVDVFTYDDVDIFTEEDVSIKKVHLYGKVENMGKAMKQMYSLFSALGGPLHKVFENALDRRCASATELSVEADGVSGIFDGERVFAGSAEYMLRHGITLPAAESRGAAFTDSTRVMYGAAEGAVYVKFFIRYSFSEEFTMLLPILREQGIVPLVYTCDPNVSDELIRVLTLGEDVMRIMKRTAPGTTESKTYRRLSAGTVSLGDKCDAINLVLLAKRYVAFLGHMRINQIVAAVAGAIIALTFAFTGITIFPASALCLVQLAWCVYLYFRTRLSFDTKPKEKRN